MDHRDFSRRLASLAVALLCVLAGGSAFGMGAFQRAAAHAQGASGWTTPAVLYSEKANSYQSSLAADPFGAAHLVWADPDEPTYYYSRWDGARWTAPVDVIAMSGGAERLGVPELVAGADGKLHLFWAVGSVMHSWAWTESASSARLWSTPEPVVSPNGSANGPMGVVQDAAGRFYLVYSLYHEDVYYVHSYDSRTWSEPVRVSQVAPDTSTSAPKLAVGPDGTLHVVWNEWPVATGPAQENHVFYARSTDGGASWSAPQQLGGIADSGGNVLTAANGTVYLVWQAGIYSASQGRFLQRSTNGGQTWEAPVNFSTAKAQSGTPTMALDSAGTLHVLTGDGEYVWWDGHTVSTAIDLRPKREHVENARLAVVAGNQVLAIVMPFDLTGIYSSVRQMSLPALPTTEPPAPLPATAAPLATGVTETPTVPTVIAIAAVVNASAFPPGSSATSTVQPLLLSAGLSLALVAAVLIVQMGRRR